jgi:hypothetical protein
MELHTQVLYQILIVYLVCFIVPLVFRIFHVFLPGFAAFHGFPAVFLCISRISRRFNGISRIFPRIFTVFHGVSAGFYGFFRAFSLYFTVCLPVFTAFYGFSAVFHYTSRCVRRFLRHFTDSSPLFQLFKDKEEVLRKSNLLRGSNVYVTEDFSRKIRKHREELLKFAREIRARDPSARVVLQVLCPTDFFLIEIDEEKWYSSCKKIWSSRIKMASIFLLSAYLQCQLPMSRKQNLQSQVNLIECALPVVRPPVRGERRVPVQRRRAESRARSHENAGR